MSKQVIITELRKKSDVELYARIGELKKEIFLCRSSGVGSEEKKLNNKKKLFRKELARVMTISRERELNETSRELLL